MTTGEWIESSQRHPTECGWYYVSDGYYAVIRQAHRHLPCRKHPGIWKWRVGLKCENGQLDRGLIEPFETWRYWWSQPIEMPPPPWKTIEENAWNQI